ncbi:MAG: 4Fe-4S binding protein, partial [Treponema sp.]|nr:4Fe-4S binding protein [Treponema sp.]
KVCKLDISVYKNPNSLDCIRCEECRASCPHGAIHF